MASQPPTNEVFFREVDEELRRDEMAEFARRFGVWIIVGIVAVLLALGGYLYWRHHQEQAAGVEGEQFQQAIESLGANKVGDAAKQLGPLAESNTPGYRAMARFTEADILLQKNDLKGAAAKFASIAQDQKLAAAFRDLALIRQTAAEYDSLKPEVVINRLRGLAVKGSPWIGSAGEMVALAHLRQGRADLAGKLFGEIAATEHVPESIRQRAVQMSGTLGVDAVDQNEDKAAQ
ncbi:tetratricopeptide repeat protein [Hephaestia sp. GCM10023244]|uniref:tetratricopeptide repeat protein n=1 Tax=unclassified Hephaestia TaxID=2631281 RepID=UPI002077859B|nr:tetratricopeptide repeat protein [Hephaestia sp. MAHUQ-44]MCM8730793.1 tetratricopeptide repeat protein [Hephaestia sp. MAHUQ-44]